MKNLRVILASGSTFLDEERSQFMLSAGFFNGLEFVVIRAEDFGILYNDKFALIAPHQIGLVLDVEIKFFFQAHRIRYKQYRSAELFGKLLDKEGANERQHNGF